MSFNEFAYTMHDLANSQLFLIIACFAVFIGICAVFTIDD